MATKNWRAIFNGRIQTYSEKVWLWDDTLGVAVMVGVPCRPWANISPDFTHWMAAIEGEATPTPPMYVSKVAVENSDGTVTVTVVNTEEKFIAAFDDTF